jgi:hypothetical protein
VGTAITEAPGDPEILRIVGDGLRKIDADFEARFKLARSAGELKQGADPKALALLASATMHTLAIRARAGSSKAELRKLAQKAVGVMCG